jgi:hypothetical protein
LSPWDNCIDIAEFAVPLCPEYNVPRRPHEFARLPVGALHAAG